MSDQNEKSSETKQDAVWADVREWGAVGDGVTNDTTAIQRAIDACAQAGGGVVRLHSGRFLSGTVMLRSNVELHLSATARLLGVTGLSLYHRDTITRYVAINRSLIYANGCENIAITGQGTIDGQGSVFRRDMEHAHGVKWFDVAERSGRPILVRLRDCKNVRIEGVLLTNSPSLAINPIHCQQVRIEGVRVKSRVMPNNDCLGVDGCQDVFISNCNFSSDDDCIALRTTEPGLPCTDIVITNCVLSSGCAAIRVGPDAVTNIERVSASNCVIRDTRLNGIKIQEVYGAVMRDMVFSNMVMDNVAGPISIRLAGWKMGSENPWSVRDDSRWPEGRLENILFDNIRARVMPDYFKLGIWITGTSQTRPKNITFSNIDITFPGGGTAEDAARRNVPDHEREYPETGMFGTLPAYGLYVHHADGITLNNVRFDVVSDELRPAIDCDDVTNLELAGFRASGNVQAESLIRLQNTRRAFITGSRPLNLISTFVRVEGAGSEQICLRNNVMDLAAKEMELACEDSNPEG